MKFCGNLLPSSEYFLEGAVKHKVVFIIWIALFLRIQVGYAINTFSLKNYCSHGKISSF